MIEANHSFSKQIEMSIISTLEREGIWKSLNFLATSETNKNKYFLRINFSRLYRNENNVIGLLK